jgi:hypothetical protein
MGTKQITARWRNLELIEGHQEMALARRKLRMRRLSPERFQTQRKIWFRKVRRAKRRCWEILQNGEDEIWRAVAGKRPTYALPALIPPGNPPAVPSASKAEARTYFDPWPFQPMNPLRRGEFPLLFGHRTTLADSSALGYQSRSSITGWPDTFTKLEQLRVMSKSATRDVRVIG